MLLLARVSHPELRRKVAALAGIAEVVAKKPAVLESAMREFLSRDTTITSTLLVLQILLETEPPPFPLTLKLRQEMEGAPESGVFGVRALSGGLLRRAGVRSDKTVCNRRPRLDAPALVLPEQQERLLLAIDREKRVEQVEEVFPGFASSVARRFYDLRNSQGARDRILARWQAATSRRLEGLPATPVLFWEQELFEVALHSALDDLYSMSKAESRHRLRRAVPSLVLPRAFVHIASWHSRVPRPMLPSPAEQTQALEDVMPITDGEYASWIRCGYFERQLLVSSMTHCDGTATAVAGLLFVDALDPPRLGDSPLAEGHAGAWWADYDVDLDATSRFAGPVVGIDVVRDLLGWVPLLALQPGLAVQLRLNASESCQRPLVLRDSSNRAAVVFRSWGVRAVGEGISEENLRFQGCDLLMRPDAFRELSSICAGEPVMARVTLPAERPRTRV